MVIWSKVRSQVFNSLWGLLCIVFLSGGLSSCSDKLNASTPLVQSSPEPVITQKLAEVAPPSVIEALTPSLDQYQPQVTILSPQRDQVFDDTTVTVQLQVEDLPVFKDSDWQLGTHLHFILDNDPSQAVYDLNEPIILENLAPGSHTLRVFAVRPWDESFKNEGAYAQTTFHVVTKTHQNAPDDQLPLLTYNSPHGEYGAQPILVDFYLTNAPLHAIAQENPDDDLPDWRIRVTINGESFLTDTWQPLYLTGFEKGKNWVKLEFIDEQGNIIDNAFNTTVRLIDYHPDGTDTLSKLVRGELSAEVVRGIVDPNATTLVAPVAEPTLAPEVPEVEDTLIEIVEPESTTSEPDTLEERINETLIEKEVTESPTEPAKTEVIEEETTKSAETEVIQGEVSQTPTPVVSPPPLETKPQSSAVTTLESKPLPTQKQPFPIVESPSPAPIPDDIPPRQSSIEGETSSPSTSVWFKQGLKQLQQLQERFSGQ